MWWHTVTHVRGSEGETAEWNGYPVLFTLPRNMVYSALLPLMRTPRLPVVEWTDAPADLNGLVRFAERQNLVSARVPSHFKRSLHNGNKHPQYLLLMEFTRKKPTPSFKVFWQKCVTKTTSGTCVLTWKLRQCWLGCKEIMRNLVASYVNRTAERGTGITI